MKTTHLMPLLLAAVAFGLASCAIFDPPPGGDSEARYIGRSALVRPVLLDPTRKIREQDCVRPLVDEVANLKCT